MKSRDFVYWLQGFFEIRGELQDDRGLDAKQTECIKKHLNMVFAHEIDPSFSDRETLEKIHNPEPPNWEKEKAVLEQRIRDLEARPIHRGSSHDQRLMC